MKRAAFCQPRKRQPSMSAVDISCQPDSSFLGRRLPNCSFLLVEVDHFPFLLVYVVREKCSCWRRQHFSWLIRLMLVDVHFTAFFIMPSGKTEMKHNTKGWRIKSRDRDEKDREQKSKLIQKQNVPNSKHSSERKYITETNRQMPSKYNRQILLKSEQALSKCKHVSKVFILH